MASSHYRCPDRHSQSQQHHRQQQRNVGCASAAAAAVGNGVSASEALGSYYLDSGRDRRAGSSALSRHRHGGSDGAGGAGGDVYNYDGYGGGGGGVTAAPFASASSSSRRRRGRVGSSHQYHGRRRSHEQPDATAAAVGGDLGHDLPTWPVHTRVLLILTPGLLSTVALGVGGRVALSVLVLGLAAAHRLAETAEAGDLGAREDDASGEGSYTNNNSNSRGTGHKSDYVGVHDDDYYGSVDQEYKGISKGGAVGGGSDGAYGNRHKRAGTAVEAANLRVRQQKQQQDELGVAARFVAGLACIIYGAMAWLDWSTRHKESTPVLQPSAAALSLLHAPAVAVCMWTGSRESQIALAKDAPRLYAMAHVWAAALATLHAAAFMSETSYYAHVAAFDTDKAEAATFSDDSSKTIAPEIRNGLALEVATQFPGFVTVVAASAVIFLLLVARDEYWLPSSKIAGSDNEEDNGGEGEKEEEKGEEGKHEEEKRGEPSRSSGSGGSRSISGSLTTRGAGNENKEVATSANFWSRHESAVSRWASLVVATSPGLYVGWHGTSTALGLDAPGAALLAWLLPVLTLHVLPTKGVFWAQVDSSSGASAKIQRQDTVVPTRLQALALPLVACVLAFVAAIDTLSMTGVGWGVCACARAGNSGATADSISAASASASAAAAAATATTTADVAANVTRNLTVSGVQRIAVVLVASLMLLITYLAAQKQKQLSWIVTGTASVLVMAVAPAALACGATPGIATVWFMVWALATISAARHNTNVALFSASVATIIVWATYVKLGGSQSFYVVRSWLMPASLALTLITTSLRLNREPQKETVGGAGMAVRIHHRATRRLAITQVICLGILEELLYDEGKYAASLVALTSAIACWHGATLHTRASYHRSAGTAALVSGLGVAKLSVLFSGGGVGSDTITRSWRTPWWMALVTALGAGAGTGTGQSVGSSAAAINRCCLALAALTIIFPYVHPDVLASVPPLMCAGMLLIGWSCLCGPVLLYHWYVAAPAAARRALTGLAAGLTLCLYDATLAPPQLLSEKSVGPRGSGQAPSNVQGAAGLVVLAFAVITLGELQAVTASHSARRDQMRRQAGSTSAVVVTVAGALISAVAGATYCLVAASALEAAPVDTVLTPLCLAGALSGVYLWVRPRLRGRTALTQTLDILGPLGALALGVCALWGRLGEEASSLVNSAGDMPFLCGILVPLHVACVHCRRNAASVAARGRDSIAADGRKKESATIRAGNSARRRQSGRSSVAGPLAPDQTMSWTLLCAAAAHETPAAAAHIFTCISLWHVPVLGTAAPLLAAPLVWWGAGNIYDDNHRRKELLVYYGAWKDAHAPIALGALALVTCVVIRLLLSESEGATVGAVMLELLLLAIAIVNHVDLAGILSRPMTSFRARGTFAAVPGLLLAGQPGTRLAAAISILYGLVLNRVTSSSDGG